MNLQKMANAIRALTIDAISKAKSGHPGMPIGMADVATVLFSKFLKFDPQNPDWPDRDRFVLSAGHGSMLLYALLYLTGYNDINIDEIKNFRQLHAKTAGHPEYGAASGIENTSGPLGQGIANAVGMALAECILNSRFGARHVDHYTYVIAGDGCLMEGISHEAASLAGHLGLGKLIVFFDDNNVSIDGSTDLTVSDNQIQRFSSYGWHTITIDGHNYDNIEQAIKSAQEHKEKPSLIACKTIIGKFIPNKAGTSGAHSWPLSEEEVSGFRQNLKWDYEPFTVPDDILSDWRKLGRQDLYKSWKQEVKQEFQNYIDCKLPDNFDEIFLSIKASCTQTTEATRKSSGNVLTDLAKHLPQLIGGSADLTGSNNTQTKTMQAVSKENFSGSYIYYGVREHAMAACMNGMSLHKGIIPYGGTFFVFTDYCRPAIRLSALMEQRVIYIMTHYSMVLGEDGPTHQPIEHLSSLRAMPNINVLRPADAIEVTESWQIALQSITTPSILVLSRQANPQVCQFREENLVKYGAYIIAEHKYNLEVTIIATGSEVSIALQAKEKLEKDQIGVRVISMPCQELFDQQTQQYKDNLLANDSIKVAIEAASSYGWQRYIGIDGIFIGLDCFGASAPAQTLYEHFQITVEHVVKECKNKFLKKVR